MENQKQLKKYTNAFIDALSSYLKKGFQVSATIHPASEEGAVIEFEIHVGKRSDITIVSTVPRVNDTLEKIDQRMIGGNIQGVTFRGTNLYMDGQRAVIIKGEDDHTLWSNIAASEDVSRVVSPRGGAK
jgi:hypothetical protein